MIEDFLHSLLYSCDNTANYLAAIATFLAAIVTLFKESIIGLWNRPKISLPESGEILNLQEILPKHHTQDDSETDISDENDLLTAKQYLFKLSITNSGRLPATGCKIILEKLSYREKEESKEIPISEISGVPLDWAQSNNKYIDIPPFGGNERIELISILSKEDVSQKKESKAETPSLIIGDSTIRQHHHSGIHAATFAIYCQNHKPIRFTITLSWNGKWEPRESEMKNNASLSIARL